MAKIIASLTDGRVVPWLSDDPVPERYVVIPQEYVAKFQAGEIADGVELAKAALASGDAEVGTAPSNAAPPPRKAGRPPKAESEGASSLRSARV